jgi:hypothetical protein
MERKKSAPKKSGNKQRANAGSSAPQKTGGREFGNVIEPMQAQMASGNQGLAGDVGSRSSEGHSQPGHGKKPGA